MARNPQHTPRIEAGRQRGQRQLQLLTRGRRLDRQPEPQLQPMRPLSADQPVHTLFGGQPRRGNRLAVPFVTGFVDMCLMQAQRDVVPYVRLRDLDPDVGGHLRIVADNVTVQRQGRNVHRCRLALAVSRGGGLMSREHLAGRHGHPPPVALHVHYVSLGRCSGGYNRSITRGGRGLGLGRRRRNVGGVGHRLRTQRCAAEDAD